MSNILNYISNKNNNIKKAKLKKSDSQTKFDKCRVDSNKIIHTLSIRAMHHRRTNGQANHNYINASLLINHCIFFSL